MRLNVNDDSYVEDPEVELIRQQLHGLAADEYAILDLEAQHYIQTYCNEDGTYQLEYRAGSADDHFQTMSPVKLEDVEQAFVNYANSEENWQQEWTWKRVEFDTSEELDGLTSADGYLINGEEFQKIAVGSESRPVLGANGKCEACEISEGSFHSPGCELEECPCCSGILVECDCE